MLANLSTYTADPGQILQVWQGGLSSFGGLLFGVPTGVILARRRCPELTTVRALDIVSPVLMAAWGVGRLLGPQLMVAGGGTPTHAWFGMYYSGEVGKRVPVPIFQAIDSFVIFGILLLIERRYRDRPVGFVLAATMALWGLARFLRGAPVAPPERPQLGRCSSRSRAGVVRGRPRRDGRAAAATTCSTLRPTKPPAPTRHSRPAAPTSSRGRPRWGACAEHLIPGRRVPALAPSGGGVSLVSEVPAQRRQRSTRARGARRRPARWRATAWPAAPRTSEPCRRGGAAG